MVLNSKRKLNDVMRKMIAWVEIILSLGIIVPLTFWFFPQVINPQLTPDKYYSAIGLFWYLGTISILVFTCGYLSLRFLKAAIRLLIVCLFFIFIRVMIQLVAIRFDINYFLLFTQILECAITIALLILFNFSKFKDDFMSEESN